jgi:hypothetical protein
MRGAITRTDQRMMRPPRWALLARLCSFSGLPPGAISSGRCRESRVDAGWWVVIALVNRSRDPPGAARCRFCAAPPCLVLAWHL